MACARCHGSCHWGNPFLLYVISILHSSWSNTGIELQQPNYHILPFHHAVIIDWNSVADSAGAHTGSYGCSHCCCDLKGCESVRDGRIQTKGVESVYIHSITSRIPWVYGWRWGKNDQGTRPHFTVEAQEVWYSTHRTISGVHLWLLCSHLDDAGLQMYQHVHQRLQFMQQLTRGAYKWQERGGKSLIEDSCISMWHIDYKISDG